MATTKSKKRHPNRMTETNAITAIRRYCSDYGLIFQAEPREDYGVDCYIEVALEDRPQNFLVGVQSKSGQSYIRRRRNALTQLPFKIDLRPADIEYWLAANYPIIFMYADDLTGEQFFTSRPSGIRATARLNSASALMKWIV